MRNHELQLRESRDRELRISKEIHEYAEDEGGKVFLTKIYPQKYRNRKKKYNTNIETSDGA